MTRWYIVWKGYKEFIEEQHGFQSQEYANAALAEPPQTCLLPDGHAGPHEWTLDANITVDFRTPPTEKP